MSEKIGLLRISTDSDFRILPQIQNWLDHFYSSAVTGSGKTFSCLASSDETALSNSLNIAAKD
jgi:hypothetical protein